MDTNKIKIDEGTINFWIKENQIVFNDFKTTPIFAVNPDGGSIFIIKDADNKLKVFYVVLGRGRVDLEFDISHLEQEKKHMITYTWSLKEKSLNLYIDGGAVSTKTIPF